MAGPPQAGVTRRIHLPEHVQNLRHLLLDAAQFGEKQGKWQDLKLRFAGGWVRDMLLKRESDDIDVALSSTTGHEFSILLAAFLKDVNDLNKYGLTLEDIGRAYKVEANPEKSKQLETAGMKVGGMDLDFVNLRKEVYDPSSRTPIMEFGTAREDALRRDATINSLFYNLQTEEVEDFTESGLADIEAKLLRTPLEPRQTFMDDPLRILRLIRFASRLDFAIVDECRTCMREKEILGAFMSKISRERVGIELDKMLKGHDPRASLILFDELALYSTIFSPIVKAEDNSSTERWMALVSETISTENWSDSYNSLQEILENDAPRSIRQLLIQNDEIPVAWLLACLAPLSQACLPVPLPSGKLDVPYATRVAKEGIKQTHRVCELVTGASRHIEEITSFKNSVVSGKSFESEKDSIGMAIRKWEERGGQWKLQVLFAILAEALQISTSRSSESRGRNQLLASWQQFLDHVDDIGVMDAASRKRLVDGKMLQKALGLKPGKWMKDAMDVCMSWQFRNPESTEILEAIAEVANRAEELGIPSKR